MNLNLNSVSAERINELESLCKFKFLEISKKNIEGDLPYITILQELCKFANSVEEVCLISATIGKFLLK